MYSRGYYKNLDRKSIEKDVKKEGFDPILIHNEAGYIYHEHQHPETKLLVFLDGEMDLVMAGKRYHCVPGDKVIVPGNTRHAAIVGKDGCTFFWSEKII